MGRPLRPATAGGMKMKTILGFLVAQAAGPVASIGRTRARAAPGRESVLIPSGREQENVE